MKKLIISLILLLICFSLTAQNFTRTFQFSGKTYIYRIEEKEDATYRVTINEDDKDATKAEFTIKPLVVETFIAGFRDKFKSLLAVTPNPTMPTPEQEGQITNTANLMFYNSVATILNENETEAPLAGKLIVASQVKEVRKAKPKELFTKGNVEHKENYNFIVKDVDITFEEGFIETIKARGYLETKDGKPYQNIDFANLYGIGFSSRTNFKNFDNVFLYDTKSNAADAFNIKLNDLIYYDYSVNVMTRDYSPANQKISTYGGQSVNLHKEESSKLLEAIVYSDFLGFENEKPNGLVQLEFNKKININTTRRQAYTFPFFLFKAYNYLQFIRPSFTLSKIEEKRKVLYPFAIDSILETPVNGNTEYRLKKYRYTTPIHALNYQKLALELDLNAFYFENPDFKFQGFINLGFRFGATAIADTIINLNNQNEIEKMERIEEYDLTYFSWFPEFVLQFLPEGRYGLTFTARPQVFKFNSDRVKLRTIDSETQSFTTHRHRIIKTVELMGFRNAGRTGKLFARWRYNSELGNSGNNFHQVQVGYSFFITGDRQEERN